MTKLGSEPAYPVVNEDLDGNDYPGMTIRQAYVMAIGASVSQKYNISNYSHMNDVTVGDISAFAVHLADALLKREAETRE